MNTKRTCLIIIGILILLTGIANLIIGFVFSPPSNNDDVHSPLSGVLERPRIHRSRRISKSEIRTNDRFIQTSTNNAFPENQEIPQVHHHQEHNNYNDAPHDNHEELVEDEEESGEKDEEKEKDEEGGDEGGGGGGDKEEVGDEEEVGEERDKEEEEEPQQEDPNDNQSHFIVTEDAATEEKTNETSYEEIGILTQMTQTEAHQVITDPNHKLPQWIINYFEWHASMREKFPGDEILTHPDAPPILIRKCVMTQCGGLHDRLGQLPMDLYLANQTQRMLFLVWLKPYSLEHFMVPPDASLDGNEYSFNWVMPPYEMYGTKCNKRKMCAVRLMALPQLETNMRAYRKEKMPFKPVDQLVEESIYNLTQGIYKDEKAVTYELLSHLKENVLEEKLKALGETDMIHDTPSFGKIFLSFFAPSEPVQKILDKIRHETGLVSQQYTAVHCRVRHPFGYRPGTKFNGRYAGKADRDIPDFSGEWKIAMLGTAIHAIRCAATIDAEDKMYFMSDMSDLVEYMAFNLTDERYITSHPEWFENETTADSIAKGVVSRYKIVAREQKTPNLHIDKAEMTAVEDYYGSFVDLFLGIHAKCVSYGIGFYAAFAAKISGTHCVVKYAYEKYGGNKEKVKAEDQGIRCNHRLALKL